MRSLFESLAWQALGLPPEIAPVPNRGNKTNATADGFDLLSPASNRSWLELSGTPQTPSTDWLAGEQEWASTTGPSPLKDTPPASPPAPSETDTQSDSHSGETNGARRDDAGTDTEQGASASLEKIKQLQQNSRHAPEYSLEHREESRTIPAQENSAQQSLEAPRTEMCRFESQQDAEPTTGTYIADTPKASRGATFAAPEAPTSHSSPLPAPGETVFQAPIPCSIETQPALHIGVAAQFAPPPPAYACEQKNAGACDHPLISITSAQTSTDARSTQTGTHVTAAIKSDADHAQVPPVQSESPNLVASENSAIDYSFPAQLPHPVTRNYGTPQSNADASASPRNMEALQRNHDVVTPSHDRTAPHESLETVQREEDSRITSAPEPAPATYYFKNDASASQKSPYAELDQPSFILEPQHPAPVSEAAAPYIASPPSVASAHPFNRQETSDSASDKSSTADAHDPFALAESPATPGTRHKSDGSSAAAAQLSSFDGMKASTFPQQVSTPLYAEPQLQRDSRIEAAPAISQNLLETVTSHAALAASAATGIPPQRQPHIRRVSTSDYGDKYANTEPCALTSASASPAPESHFFNTNFSAGYISAVDTTVVSHASAVQSSQKDPPQTSHRDHILQAPIFRTDNTPAQIASCESTHHRQPGKPGLVPETRHEPASSLPATHLPAPTTANAQPAHAFPETNQYAANVATTAPANLPTSRSAQPQPIIEAASLSEDSPNELSHTHHCNTPGASPAANTTATRSLSAESSIAQTQATNSTTSQNDPYPASRNGHPIQDDGAGYIETNPHHSPAAVAPIASRLVGLESPSSPGRTRADSTKVQAMLGGIESIYAPAASDSHSRVDSSATNISSAVPNRQRADASHGAAQHVPFPEHALLHTPPADSPRVLTSHVIRRSTEDAPSHPASSSARKSSTPHPSSTSPYPQRTSADTIGPSYASSIRWFSTASQAEEFITRRSVSGSEGPQPVASEFAQSLTRTNPAHLAHSIPSIESAASASPEHLAASSEPEYVSAEPSPDASTPNIAQPVVRNFLESNNAAMQESGWSYASAPAATSLPQPTPRSTTAVPQQVQPLREISAGEESTAPLEFSRKRINALSSVSESAPAITTNQRVLQDAQQKPVMPVPNMLPVQSKSALPAPPQTADALYFPRSIPRRMEAPSEPAPLRIDIGRIDVERADVSVSSSARTRRPRPIARFTLDQYLKQRSRSR